MASNGNDPDAQYALSRLLQRGKAFALACVAETQLQDLEETTRPKPNKVEAVKTNDAKPQISTDTFGSNGCNDSETSCPETPTEEVVNNGIENEVVVGFQKEFQEGDMVDALLEQRSLGNWKELDNESEDWKVERDAKREGEPTILATFRSDRGITIWDPEIKIVFKKSP
ncbi:hypothetical protein Tco_0079749 [Tanacetum coccineum]